jgi:hypothetical protein
MAGQNHDSFRVQEETVLLNGVSGVAASGTAIYTNLSDIVIYMDVHTTRVNSPPRRWPRHGLAVPLRVVIHTPDKTVIRDGRGGELSEGGMCFSAGVELKMGDQVEVEFTPAYSGHPIRVRAVARNVNGYSYGVEFAASSDQERREIAYLCDNLQALSSSYSPSYSSFL